MTGLSFFTKAGRSLLASVSKDTLLKVWDMTTLYCVQTIVGHRCEVWALHNLDHAGILLTGCSDELIRGYTYRDDTDESAAASTTIVDGIQDEEAILRYCGAIKRAAGADRCGGLSTNSNQSLLVVQAQSKTVELFLIRDAVAAKKKMKRRLKRLREKMAKVDDDDVDTDEISPSTALADWIDSMAAIRATSRVRSAVLCSFSSSNIDTKHHREKLLLTLTNNSIELYQVPLQSSDEITVKAPEPPSKLSTIDIEGHRSDIRSVVMSTDGLLLATCASDSVKVWSSVTTSCVSTCRIEGGSNESTPLCMTFAPGGKYLVIGTKAGHLLVVDTASGDVSYRVGGSSAAGDDVDGDDLDERDSWAHTGRVFIFICFFLYTDLCIVYYYIRCCVGNIASSRCKRADDCIGR